VVVADAPPSGSQFAPFTVATLVQSPGDSAGP
jgi:hypothetical protein